MRGSSDLSSSPQSKQLENSNTNMNYKIISSVINRPLPNAVTYDLSTPRQVHITLPKASTWSSGLHWHEAHTEWLCLMKGSIWVQLGDTKETFTVNEGQKMEIQVPRYTWHEWGRSRMDDEDVEVIERTDPADGDKAIFFWNLNGVILNAPKNLTDSWIISRLPSRLQGLFLDLWIPLNLFVIFRYLDNVPVFLNAPKLVPVSNDTVKALLRNIDMVVSHLVLWIASCAGGVLGLKPVQARYTPAKEFEEWYTRQADSKKIE
ncbi:hypothetical protein FSPOR_6076 [Fusarium sporotrichioides]|uniref:Uncharacterized protein n=1 Tax=Fusarium sporotrichioides TaxID=5514 RepID=A0A395S503_FUSSP|nr:hypothetical protein FSPOR_6076 [Fusarium sporotrichioides]